MKQGDTTKGRLGDIGIPDNKMTYSILMQTWQSDNALQLRGYQKTIGLVIRFKICFR